jgi:hypothetical protein
VVAPPTYDGYDLVNGELTRTGINREDRLTSIKELLRPIADAPFQKDEPCGTCLFKLECGWALGEWDGAQCQDFDHGPVEPTHYLLLDC